MATNPRRKKSYRTGETVPCHLKIGGELSICNKTAAVCERNTLIIAVEPLTWSDERAKILLGIVGGGDTAFHEILNLFGFRRQTPLHICVVETGHNYRFKPPYNTFMLVHKKKEKKNEVDG